MPACFVNQTDMSSLRHDIRSLYEGNKNKLFYFFASPCLPERNHSWCYPPLLHDLPQALSRRFCFRP